MMDLATAAKAVAGRVQGGNVRFTRVVTDSRQLQPGDLFVALAGERYDGHDFVADALQRGAVAAMVSAARGGQIAGNLVVVADTLAALGALAGYWRRQFALPLIAVVGSNGKTTVKEMIATILRTHYGEREVLATQGNLNNAIGLPLTLLRLSAEHRAAVVEIGMNHPGETAVLAELAQPGVAVVNNAQREHQEFMRSIRDVADEHAAVVRALGEGGIAVLNADDAHVDVWRDAARAAGATAVEFALDHPAAVRDRGRPGANGGVVELSTPAGDATVRLAAPGRHNVANALAAATATLAIGVPLLAIVRGLEAFRPVPGRLVARATAHGATVIDDSYNANPDSVRAAIAVLAARPAPRWLVLGDMGEVGAQGPAFHREAGSEARAAGLDALFTTGLLAAEAAAAYGPGALHFATPEELAQHVVARVAPGTTVLVKGSRFMRMERVVAALLATAPEGVH
ncbi:MAG: UDP-N-acetylmuramoyl-tripeptide--D-alanyl-D-alanine ligase [Betaproteobacteria bacterium]|nr:UDP-N-acetylmuramoyl-tripeptide--D-alanyl-D-alanine ligase [Betaproteobacteria bacterium]MBK7082410.1 UDP-N-acetylmuramoyl-tripeptide--D-alanyl-D-alanine ligase [Betaproteobacteria bacterium]